MRLTLLGLAFIGFGLYDIYDGTSAFFLFGKWWMWPRYDRGADPIMFWCSVSLNFVFAAACFVGAIVGNFIT